MNKTHNVLSIGGTTVCYNLSQKENVKRMDINVKDNNTDEVIQK